MAHYHKRSNVESVFSMVKAKFRDSVRSKTDVAMVNETLAKFICNNLCCVIMSQAELGIEGREEEQRGTEYPARPLAHPFRLSSRIGRY